MSNIILLAVLASLITIELIGGLKALIAYILFKKSAGQDRMLSMQELIRHSVYMSHYLAFGYLGAFGVTVILTLLYVLN